MNTTLGEKALKVLSDFVLRKVPEGIFNVRTFCACSDYRRLDIKTAEEAVNILNEVFEKFGSLIEDWEVNIVRSWLRPYGVEIEKIGNLYRAKIVKTGYEEKVEEVIDYYCCGMKKQAQILAKAVLDGFAKERGFKNFEEMIKARNNSLREVLLSIYSSLERDLSDEEIIFIIKTIRNVLELCSSLQV